MAEFGPFLPRIYLIYSIRNLLMLRFLARIDTTGFTFPYQRKRGLPATSKIYEQIWALEVIY